MSLDGDFCGSPVGRAAREGKLNALWTNPTRVFRLWRLSGSICMKDQRLTIIAWSRPSPTVPNDGRRPAERIFSPKTSEVN